MDADAVWRLSFGNLLSKAEYLGPRALEKVLAASQDRILDYECRVEREDGRRQSMRWGSRASILVHELGPSTRIRRVRDRFRVGQSLLSLWPCGVQRKRYSPEGHLCAAELATRTSYGVASQTMERMGLRAPRRTIWDILQESAQQIEATI